MGVVGTGEIMLRPASWRNPELFKKNRRGEEYLFKHQDKILEKVFIKVADHFILHDLEGFERGDLLLVGAH